MPVWPYLQVTASRQPRNHPEILRLLARDHAVEYEEGAIEKLPYYEKTIPPHWKK